VKHAFSAPSAKTQRARKHLAELEEEVATYIAGVPAKFNATPTMQDGLRRIEISAHFSGPPESMGVIVGDIVHNLRAALDLTACEMVRAAGESDKDVYFPFCRTANELDEAISKRHFDRAGTAAVQLVRSIKPYKNGNIDLRTIHDLDIHDKHRALIPQVLGAASPVIRMWDDDGSINPTVIGDPAAASEVRLIFPADCEPHGRELVPTLYGLVEVVEGVIEAFRSLANLE
jgi:hypothetical protein